MRAANQPARNLPEGEMTDGRSGERDSRESVDGSAPVSALEPRPDPPAPGDLRHDHFHPRWPQHREQHDGEPQESVIERPGTGIAPGEAILVEQRINERSIHGGEIWRATPQSLAPGARPGLSASIDDVWFAGERALRERGSEFDSEPPGEIAHGVGGSMMQVLEPHHARPPRRQPVGPIGVDDVLQGHPCRENGSRASRASCALGTLDGSRLTVRQQVWIKEPIEQPVHGTYRIAYRVEEQDVRKFLDQMSCRWVVPLVQR